MAEPVLFEVSERIATLTLNRPDKLNAFTDPMLERLVALIDECAARADVAVVILTGAGRGFCTGGDVSGMGADVDNRPHATKDYIWTLIQSFAKRLARFDKPIIAAVNGAAAGAGMDLALACDLRVAGHGARFAETYARLGLLPGAGGAWFLPHLVGRGMAMELLLSGRWVDAEEALRIGLVNHVWPDDELAARTRALAQSIARNPPLSVRLIKRAVDHAFSADLDTCLDLVSSHIAITKSGPDHAEAVEAFREKREGVFRGY